MFHGIWQQRKPMGLCAVPDGDGWWAERCWLHQLLVCLCGVVRLFVIVHVHLKPPMHDKQSSIRHHTTCGFYLSHCTPVPYLMVTVGEPDSAGSISCSSSSVWCGEAVGGCLCAFETADARITKSRRASHDIWLSFEPLHACAVPDGDGW